MKKYFHVRIAYEGRLIWTKEKWIDMTYNLMIIHIDGSLVFKKKIIINKWKTLIQQSNAFYLPVELLCYKHFRQRQSFVLSLLKKNKSKFYFFCKRGGVR